MRRKTKGKSGSASLDGRLAWTCGSVRTTRVRTTFARTRRETHTSKDPGARDPRKTLHSCDRWNDHGKARSVRYRRDCLPPRRSFFSLLEKKLRGRIGIQHGSFFRDVSRHVHVQRACRSCTGATRRRDEHTGHERHLQRCTKGGRRIGTVRGGGKRRKRRVSPGNEGPALA